MQTIERAIREHADALFANLRPEVQRLINNANRDLYFGPSVADDGYPGFRLACEAISDAVSDIEDTYIDEDGFIFDREPEGETCPETGEWIEPAPYYLIDARDLVSKVVGKELAKYL